MSNLLENLLNQILTDEQIIQIRNAYAAANQAIPFAIGLNTEQRQTIPKIATGNLNFVIDCKNSMLDNANILPAYMTVDNLNMDITLYQQLDPLVQLAAQNFERLRDTQMLAGSEAYIAALAYYRMVEAAAKAGLPGMDTVYNQLKERFANQGNQGGGTPPDGTPPTT